jgi:hypothetical protein
MANSDSELLIQLVRDVAEIKTELKAYKNLEQRVLWLEKKMWLFMGMAGSIGGSVVALIQAGITNG